LKSLSWESKVIWNEGLFLQPHHFQQADRYTEALVSGLARRISPYVWGVSALEIDTETLKVGNFAIKSCAGLTPDGTVFRVPQHDDHPPSLKVPDGVKDCVVYLSVPARRQGAIEVDMSDASPTKSRLVPHELEITDAVGSGRRAVTMGVGKLRLSFALDVDELADQLLIPIARIIEVRADGEVVLDRSFIPTSTDVRAAPPISDFLRELEGLLGHRAHALAGRLSDTGGTRAAAEITDFLLLLTVNRALPLFRHLASVENVHPERVYAHCLALAGELATFMREEKTVPEFPLYQHDNLTNVFSPLIRALRQYLSSVLEQNAVSIPLEARKYGVNVGIIADPKLVQRASFILGVKAGVPPETVRRYFATQSKVGPVEEIRQLVNSALPGIALEALPVAPRQLPYNSGLVYFELDKSSPYWAKMSTSGGIAIHVAGDFPDLQMELWAVRQG
jgi:type VI secretion system protein ImpJ